MKIVIFLFVFQLTYAFVYSQDQIINVDGEDYIYKRPKTFDFITNVPGDYVNFGKSAFRREHTLANVGIVVSTGLLIAADQKIYDEISRWGRELGIGNGDNTTTFISVADVPVFRGPTDFGSLLYFIGDGWTHLGFSLSFLTAGLINDDNRAMQTGSQIAQGMISCGLSTQFLKHITGRETPSRASQPGGIWRFFPDQVDYHKHVPKYDAFPSGHVTTAMMTLTIISENYAEYKWIRPVGYSLITILSLQMVNNGVHWASDYPLALGMGYLIGKIAVNSGREQAVKNKDNESQMSNLIISPYLQTGRTYGVSFQYTF